MKKYLFLKGNQILNKKAFTLVELIVVITILAILGTIGFMSFSSYLKGARDSNRISTLTQIQKGLTLFQIKSGKYPNPEGITSTGSVYGTELVFTGEVGSAISQQIGMSKVSTDPNFEKNYVYGLAYSKREYQIGAVIEGNIAYQYIIDSAYANNYLALIKGNYPGFMKFSTGGSDYIANIPSLLYDNTGSIDLLGNSTYYIINKDGNNLPYDLTINHVGSNITIQNMYGSGAYLTGLNISNVKDIASLKSTFTGSVLQSFGGDLGYMERIVLGTSTIPMNCRNNGIVINNNGTKAFFSVLTATRCENVKQNFTCNNGILKGADGTLIDIETTEYKFDTCIDDTTCKFDQGFNFNSTCHFG